MPEYNDTILRLRQMFADIVTASPYLQNFGGGDLSQVDVKQLNYPLLWISFSPYLPFDFNLKDDGGANDVIQFNCIIMDKLNHDRSNYWSIMNSTYAECKKIRKFLSTHKEFKIEKKNIKVLPFFDKFADGCTGFNIQVKIKDPSTFCSPDYTYVDNYTGSTVNPVYLTCNTLKDCESFSQLETRVDVLENNSGNTGSETIYKFERKITSAELLTGFSSPIELIAAQGVDKVIIPFAESIIVKYNHITTDYTASSGGQGSLYTNTATIGTDDIAITPSNMLDGSNTGFTWCLSGMLAYLAAYSFKENQPIMFKILTSDPTNGDGTLDIYFHYKILTAL